MYILGFPYSLWKKMFPLHKGEHLRDYLQNRFLWMDSRFQGIYIVKGFWPICRVKITTQEVVNCCLWFYTTRVHRVYIINVVKFYVHLQG